MARYRSSATIGTPVQIELVNERSAMLVDLTHLDVDGELVAPTTVRYRIDDAENGQEIVPWTSVELPLSQNTITVTSEQNRLQNSRSISERRRLLVEIATTIGVRYDASYFEVVSLGVP